MLGPTDLVVADASLASGWVGAHLEQSEVGRRQLFPRGLAGLGWAVPAALGAAVARPDARVFALMGDGALGYSVGELAALAQHRLNVTLIVLNNSSYGWIRWYRRIAFERGWEEDDFPATDYAAVGTPTGSPSSGWRSPATWPAHWPESPRTLGPDCWRSSRRCGTHPWRVTVRLWLRARPPTTGLTQSTEEQR